jgi:hypothetical protein
VVLAVAADARAMLNWLAPSSDGGRAITGYVVTPYLGAVAQTPIQVGIATSTTVTALTNETTYTFTVTAVNAMGPGPASAPSDPVTPNVRGGSHQSPPLRRRGRRCPNHARAERGRLYRRTDRRVLERPGLPQNHLEELPATPLPASSALRRPRGR